jgi:hypothetical protein
LLSNKAALLVLALPQVAQVLAQVLLAPLWLV